MNKKELEAFAREAAKTLKTEKDLNEFSQMLTKITVEAALNAELDEHLGYDRHQASDNANSRNGYTSKTLKTEDGQFELSTPRDREGSFEPQLVKKGQTRFTSMDDKILSLYAKGMTTREIVATFKEMYDADISPTLISKVTEAVMERVVEWQSRPWTRCIRSSTWTASWSKSGRTSRSSTRQSTWPWASTSKATRNCWACGSPRTRAPSSGWAS